ncbi:hypothetical protein GBAR_LOCUS26924 [Geodia barretti]|uniref:Uncharacterized protein n=1 Tax=Geodia barretti TaxID=519541 RepID=A0AA35X960_GEOBA|nr:hypothetical protein GBAR_LOCUS26924 [Geodia barretti]
MPEREVVVCFADEGQQARNSCPELPIFSFLSWHHMVYCYMYVWVCGVYRESCLLSCHSPLSVVHATFEKTNYVVGEGEGTFQVCVVLSIAAVRNVTVMVTGELSLDSGANSAAELGTLSVEVTIPPNDTGSCLSFTPSDDSEVEDVDEQYRLTMTKVSPDDPRFEVDGDVFTIVTITDNDADEPGSNLLPLIVGASVGGALLAVILAVLCIVCLCIWSVNVKRQGFYHTHEDSQAAPTMLRYSASLRSISSQSVVVMEGKRAAAKENEFFV